MSFPRDLTLTANAVTTVDLSGEGFHGVLDIQVISGAVVWARADGSTPSAFGLNSVNNWSDVRDPESTRHIYLDAPADGLLRLFTTNTNAQVRITRVPPLTNVLRLNRGYGISSQIEYPSVTTGVTAIVLSNSYRAGDFVRVDFQNDSSDFAVTADGTTPSLTSAMNTPFGGLTHLVQLGQTPPEQSLKVFATSGSTFPQNIRVQKVSASAMPAA